MNQKKQVEQLFIDMCGCRYNSYQEMEDWFREKLKEPMPNLVITQCSGINDEIANGEAVVDYATDCTFGKNTFEMDYADFTVHYIMDNAKNMYVTSVMWS